MFTLPKLDGLDEKQLKATLDDAIKAHGDLAKLDDDKITDEQLDELEALTAGIATITAEQGTRAEAATVRAERIAAAKQAPVVPEDKDPEVDPDAEGAAAADAALDAEVAAAKIPDDAAALATEDAEAQAVVASGAAPRRSVTRQVAAAAPAPKAPVAPTRPKAIMRASGEGTKFAMGAEIPTIKDVAQAFLDRSKGMPTRKGPQGTFMQNAVATFEKPTSDAFTLKRGDQEGNYERIQNAATEQVHGGNLVAAGGWCAPSETIYDIPQLATVSGMYSLPEVNVPRGGISFTKGPDFSKIYADSGFLQTETQAEAGEVKNFIDVECPGFEEVRLDVIGYGVRAGILTNKAWPELVRHYLSETLVAHAHKKNASLINRVVALAGAPVTAGALGAVVADTLDALAMQATRLRYKFRLGEAARIEGFGPQWLLEVMRSDIAYREGTESWAITNAQIDSALAARNIYLQWVYDYQDLGAVGTAWPTTANVVLYPSGTFVAGTEDVISLSIVHDTASLAQNTFTAAFFEEALMVFNPKANGVNVQLRIDRPSGRIGSADITNGAPARPALVAA